MSKKLKAYVTVGIPASGKTTWAREKCKKESLININRDDIRMSITGSTGWGDYKFNRHTEKMVTDIQRAMVRQAFEAGRGVVISDTNLNETFRNRLIEFLKEVGYAVELVDFDVRLEVAYKRDALRANGVGRDVIYSMYQKWLEYTGRRVYVPNKGLPETVVFDVDGTLALMHPDRGPFDWDKVDTDYPNQFVVELSKLLGASGKTIVVVSGRDGSCRELTEKWLKKHGVPYDALYMRPAGNHEKDTIIKERILWNDLEPNYNIVGWFDDRPCVVRMLHEVKIPVLAVGDQNVEF